MVCLAISLLLYKVEIDMYFFLRELVEDHGCLGYGMRWYALRVSFISVTSYCG